MGEGVFDDAPHFQKRWGTLEQPVKRAVIGREAFS